MTDRPHLHQLADRVGILPEFHDIAGRLHRTTNATYEAMLSAMGFDGSTEAAAVRCLRRLDTHATERMLPAVRVVKRSAADALVLPVRLPEEFRRGPVEWRLEVSLEDQQCLCGEGRLAATESSTLNIPVLPEPGYHALRLSVIAGREQRTADCRYIVAPDRCVTTGDVLGDSRVFGVIANLYSVRSQRNWGIGDFSDLVELCRWTARQGGEFVGVNPLHALRNTDQDRSPYSPISRLYRNVAYLDPMALPEFEESPAARKLVESTEFISGLRRLRAADQVEYAAAAAAKLQVMRLLFFEMKAQLRSVGIARSAEFAAFRDAGGESLRRFAIFCALETYFAARFGVATDWRRWPVEYRRPDSAAVAEFAEAHALEVEFHQFLQFELDRQLRRAAKEAERSGMRIGLYQDLAIGSAASGSDTWANPGLFVDGARVGAPPDEYSKSGQDWGLPPIHPLKMADQGFVYWTQMLRANLAHGGALRIDHIMGLLRQYWVPPGATALEGAYVRYPAAELFGILALESNRHGALVIGEDLGTVPAGFRQLLETWGILSCQVMYFQREPWGEYLPASAYSPRSLVTTTTHDHVPLVGFFNNSDLKLRRSVGGIASDEELRDEQQLRHSDRAALLRRLTAGPEGAVLLSSKAPAMAGEVNSEDVARAVHAFLAGTPSPLLGVLLDDLLGEEEPVNLPGLNQERHPSWSRRMSASIEDLDRHPLAAAALAGLAERAEPGRCRSS